MANIKNNKIKFMLLVVAVVAMAVGVFRGIILSNYIEPDTGFYVIGTNVDLWFNIAMAAVAVLIIACGFCVKKIKAPEFLDSNSMVVVFTSALCAFLYLTVFICGVYSIASGLIQNGHEFAPAEPDAFNQTESGFGRFIRVFAGIAPGVSSNAFFLLLESLLCIPAFLNHISICSSVVREKNTKHALFAMSEAVFFALRTVEVFMDTSTQINTSQRSIELLMLCAMMMFFLFEAGMLVKRPEGEVSVAKYCVAGLAAVALPMIVVLPHLVISLFVWCGDCGFMVMDVLACSVMLFAASRLLALREDKI